MYVGSSIANSPLAGVPSGTKDPFYYPVIYVSSADQFSILPQARFPKQNS